MKLIPDRFPRGFTLMEVMIAMSIFFIAVFAILELTSQNLSAARALQQPEVDPAMLASMLSLTNELEEGTETGDFGDLFPNATWNREVFLVGTNGLFEIHLQVSQWTGGHAKNSELRFLLFRRGQNGPGGGASGGMPPPRGGAP